MDAKKLTEGQRSYEAKRAAKAGMSLDAWLRDKEKRAKEEAVAAAKVAVAEAPAKKPGFFTRLMDRAHKPI
jgi:3-hydroxyisobutyrate dehydrogenase-like beta-hydroxyacid dehydrogenase